MSKKGGSKVSKESKSFLAAAREASSLEAVDIASAAGKKTHITVLNWEADPDSIKFGDLKAFYHALDDEGKPIIRQAMAAEFDL